MTSTSFYFRYKYAAVIDMDEIILPKNPNERHWMELLQDPAIRNPLAGAASVCFREHQLIETNVGVDLLKDATNHTKEQKEMLRFAEAESSYFLTHVHSVGNGTIEGFTRKKCIHKLDKIVAIDPHTPLLCVGNNEVAKGDCEWILLRRDVAESYHYRTVCSDEAKKKGEYGLLELPCSKEEQKKVDLQKDMTIWKYKDDLLEGMRTTLTRIKNSVDEPN